MLNRIVLPMVLAGLVALYLGERTLTGHGRTVAGGGGVALLLLAFIMAALRAARAQGERRRAYTRVVLANKLIAAGVIVYGVTQGWGGGADEASHLHTVLQVAWPALVLAGLLPAVAMELAIGSMERTPTLEFWRVRLAARSAWIMVTAVIGFAALNFAANTWNHKIDVSYFKTTRVGTATQSLVATLTEPVTFTLFFPPGNDVLSQVRHYVDALAEGSRNVTVEVLDQATQPERARALKVRANGAVVIHREGKSETLLLPLDAEDARDKLRNLDTDIQQRLIRVLKPPRIAYVTTGHNERDFVPVSDDKRLGLQDFKHWLETLGFAVKRLGLAEGLGTQVPTDASVVVIAGPTSFFTAVERKTLHAYLAQGGKLLAAMDPDHGVTDDALLAPLGVRVTPALIANEHAVVRYEGHGESKYDLWTNRWGSHPMVKTLEQNAGRQVVMLMGAGSISKTPTPAPTPNAPRITFTVHAMPQSWEDKNNNGNFDPATEIRGSYEFAAAIEGPAAAPAGADARRAAQPTGAGMRAVVLSDADILSNGIIANLGNAYLIADGMRWLLGDESEAGTTESEKDIPLVHRKDDDVVWFYGVSFVVPALVLGTGWFATRHRGRAGRKA